MRGNRGFQEEAVMITMHQVFRTAVATALAAFATVTAGGGVGAAGDGGAVQAASRDRTVSKTMDR